MADDPVPAAEKRLQQLTDRMEKTLVDDEGNSPDRKVVEEVVAEKAAALEDAPLQEFVPLLVENQARNELRERGLTTDWSNDHDDRDEPVES